MSLSTPQQRMLGWFICLLSTLLFFLLFTFRTEAQTSKSGTEKGKQGKTITPGQSDAKGRALEMDGITHADLEKAQMELAKAQAELSQQDWKKIEAELAHAKVEMEAAMKASRVAFENGTMEKAMAEVEKSLASHKGLIAAEMKKAEGQIKQAQEEIALIQQGMEMLEKDGLIKNGDSINIEWEEDIMILNGKQQSKAVSDKYRKYFKHDLMKKEHKDYKNVVI